MAVTEDILKDIVDRKERLRETNMEIAKAYNVSERTILRWTQETAFGRLREEFKQGRKEDARIRVTSLVDDIVDNLADLMVNSKSDLVRWQAARTLGEWVGLHLPEVKARGDDRDETIEMLKQLNNRQAPLAELPPPRPGGALPFVEGEFVVEEKSEGKRDGEMSLEREES